MAEPGNRLRRQLESPNFDPQNHVKHLSQQSDGDRDLQEHRQKIQNLADETAQNLKKNVYKNYRQFIETAKEISYLESEMYQLSHILTEQKSIMESITQALLSTDKDETSKEMQAAFPKETEEVKQRTLTSLLEKVEGGKNIMDTPGRHLVYNGDLVEFDVDNMSPIQKVHAFLMNDCLLIANWLPNRRGTVKYKYNALYDLESFAVVNVKDNPPMKDMFKILMFPDSRIFQAENSKIKKEWLEILDETKKNKVTKDSHKKEEEPPTSPARPEVSTNPFDVDDEEPADAEDHVDLSLDWIVELPEDLDVCIALRDFEGSVDLLDKLKEYLKDQAVTQRVRELRLRVDERVRQLTEVLVFELSPDRSLRGGPRATRRAVSQLIRLGKQHHALIPLPLPPNLPFGTGLRRSVDQSLRAVPEEPGGRRAHGHTAAAHRRGHAALHPQAVQHLLHQPDGDGQGVPDELCWEHRLLLFLRGVVAVSHGHVCGRLQQAGGGGGTASVARLG